jgi:hypothetical protein
MFDISRTDRCASRHMTNIYWKSLIVHWFSALATLIRTHYVNMTASAYLIVDAGVRTHKCASSFSSFWSNGLNGEGMSELANNETVGGVHR